MPKLVDLEIVHLSSDNQVLGDSLILNFNKNSGLNPGQFQIDLDSAGMLVEVLSSYINHHLDPESDSEPGGNRE
ncbi:hypothetical protein [Moorena sp. SIO2C4]|uniref:hypothetical protein n=1 Tax=Moorena sp. SIO2C4 TaxID=2607824 RepID=UPI0013C64303|nr:hypothetical protein [Moorena sp. SIO2C4]NES43632.1 hypothetical protein [Moorena sp. SIO2C4]